MQPSARPALEADLPELVRLDRLAREHLAGERGGSTHLLSAARPEPPDPSLRADLSDDARVVLVGCLGDPHGSGVVVGYAVAEVVELRDARLLADVSELFVEADARGVGVGEALMESLVDWASRRGCSGIDARAMPGDRATKNFFESFGLVARAITVHRELDPR